jgi:ZIP family zinc transporter
MTSTNVAILGAIAGFTIFLGLPIGRLRAPSRALREVLNATATGILMFLLWEVLSHAAEPVEESLVEAVGGTQPWSSFAVRAPIVVLGLGLGLIGLAYYERWMANRAGRRFGPGAMAVDEHAAPSRAAFADPARRLALLIAVGIGVHNFGEGLAIGQAAANDATALAVTLIVGFALHNATEGFGIVGPMTGEGTRPSWGFLALMGAIGGGPTFLGTVLGNAWSSEAMSVVFFAVAAGSILYVVQELFAVNRKYGHTVLVTWLVLLGILLGFATDFVVSASGL